MLSVPFNSYATDYGDYVSDSVSYPTDNIPAFSSYVGNPLCCVIYSDFDGCFYLIRATKYASQWAFQRFVISGSYLAAVFSASYTNIYVYKYDPINDETLAWTSVYSNEPSGSGRTLNVSPVSQLHNSKFVYINSNQSFVDNSVTYTVTNDSTYSGTEGYIYANFFDSTGEYMSNDSNNNSSGQDGSGNTVIVNVDTSGIESLLSGIQTKVNSIQSDVAAIKNSFNVNLSSIRQAILGVTSSIDNNFGDLENQLFDQFDDLTAYFNGKYETLYNVILYGDKNGQAAVQEEQMKLAEFEDNLDGINDNVSSAADSLNSAGAGVADYVSTFTQFYEGIAALNYGFSAIMLFGLAFMFVKKLIGR